jgi:sugar phosphate isomerase/epimerase
MAVERVKDHIDFAQKLGSLVVIGGVRGALESDSDIAEKQKVDEKAALTQCASYARKKGVTLVLEPINRFETNLINTVGQAMELIGDIGADNIKILPDTFHMNIEEVSIEDSLKKAGEAICILPTATAALPAGSIPILVQLYLL